MKFPIIIASFLTFILTISAQLDCGPTNGLFSIAGSRVVEPIAKSWAEGYMAQCPTIKVNVTTGGDSTIGARRVCNDIQLPGESAVEIGMMSREWNIGLEATVINKAQEKYVCNIGTKGRPITQIDVAIDTLVVFLINGGLAAQCLRKLDGRGLSIDQLRWMYSNYTKAQLFASGWDLNSMPFEDNNETSHKWNEISPLCPNGEIKLSAPTSLSNAYEYFKEQILPNRTEGFGTKPRRPNAIVQSDIEEELYTFVTSSSEEIYGDAIGFFRFSFFSTKNVMSANLYGIPIKARGSTQWISPNITTIEDGTYQPFSRRIYMNVLDASLADTGPYISYGLNKDGIDRVKKLGYMAPPIKELSAILGRIGRAPSELTVAPTKVPTKAPTKVPTLVPTRPLPLTPFPSELRTNSPTEPPTVPRCGVLGQSLLCLIQIRFIFCGVIGRFLGLCRLE